MTLLNLAHVTLACIDTVNPILALRAMHRCQHGIQFERSVLFTDQPVVDPNIEVIQVRGIDDIRSYSRFVLKELNPHIQSSHLLLVQWDGFVIHPEAWRDDFLDYDYIGATWPATGTEPEMVGNGGFSLRSKKLLQALEHIQFTDFFPEDEQLARVHRSELESMGIRFAPPIVGDRFAYEFKPAQIATFGFHGFSNFPDFMASDQLADFIGSMPTGLVFNNYFLEFARKINSKVQDHPEERGLWDALHQKTTRGIEEAAPYRLEGSQTKHLISGLCRMKRGALAHQLAKARLHASFTLDNLRLLAKTLIAQ